LALLFCSRDDDPVAWRAALAREAPEVEVRIWPETGDAAAIEAALVWLPPPGLLASLPSLRAVFSLGAGVERMLADPTLPGVPLCRMVDPSMTTSMAEVALLHVLRYHRDLDTYERQQRAGVWRLVLPRPARATTVCVLGLGELGAAAATLLTRHGFTVRGWSRAARAIDGVTGHAGADGLAAALDGADIVVCLLPLTAETRGLIDAAFLARLKPGGRLVNLARGGHVVEPDLLDALATGQVAHATLDVTAVEPLPPEHPFWRHPRVTLTPHAASYSLPETGAPVVADNLRRLRSGRPLRHVVDRARGY
jgi:glyoxylate/hydroxypyruvate reductase A